MKTIEGEYAPIRELYEALLDAWNRRVAEDYAQLFTEGANVIGFDGSQMAGRAEVASAIGDIFRDHVTAAYVAKIRDIKFLAPEVAVLVAVVGMVPPGKSEINPATNAVQTLIATKLAEAWSVASFQTTPAAFHGRPELAGQLTAELSDVLNPST